MTARLLSEKTLSVINQYKNFNVGYAVTNIPYYNNRHIRARARLRAQIGKGSPKEILEEAESIAALEKVNLKALDSISLKKFLVDNNIGVDCSGFAYHVLKTEYENLKLSFPFSKGILGSLRAKFRPIENAGVTTFAHDENSRVVEIKDVLPGDVITMVNGERDHILVVHSVDYKDNQPALISYTHAIAWPTDGEYGHGVRQGTITITDPPTPLIDQLWTEADKTRDENYTYTRALKSKTELRRLKRL